ncbi:hypothetical protein FRB97_003468 [Tulasnella sp. 331]|nr:hypothetical protein FRB97_003468 [Tulasnella sp. 331]
MRTLAVDVANLVGFIIALLLYGVYISLFITTLWVYKKRHGIRVDTVRWAVVVLFILSTGSIILFLIDNVNGWLRCGTDPGGTLAYFNRHNNSIGPCKE